MTEKQTAKTKKAGTKNGDEKSDAALKEAVLKAALKDAAFDGFTDSVLARAGKSQKLDKAAMSRLFPEGPLSLIEFYSASLDQAMEKKLAKLDLPKRRIRDRIKTAILTRLELLALNKEAARRAAAMLSLPMHAGFASKLMYRTVDSMWRTAGDTSTDFNFYTKRGILAGVYGLVLVRWFNDTSEDEGQTKDFLDARIENVMQFEKFKAKTREALSQFPAFSAWAKPKSK